MRPALTVFVSWGKLRQPRFPKKKRAVCRLGLCMQEVFRRAYTAALCSAGREETWGGEFRVVAWETVRRPECLES